MMMKKSVSWSVLCSKIVSVAAIFVAGCNFDSNEFKAASSVVAYRVPETCGYGTNWFLAAAADLTNVLSKVTGRTIPLFEESALPLRAKHVIYLGDTLAARGKNLRSQELKRMEFRIVADGRNAYIVANTGTASSYGVSEFLERFADYYTVSLYGDDNPIVFNPDLVIPKCDLRGVPAIYVRNVFDYHFFGGGKGDETARKVNEVDYLMYANFTRRTRVAAINDEYEPEDRVSMRTKSAHSSFDYVQPSKYLKDHPEYFSYYKRDGKRHGALSKGQICYTSEGAFNAAYKSLVGYIEADRKVDPENCPKIYDFTQQDFAAFCECEKCEKIYAKYNAVKGNNRTGGSTAAQFFFMNRLAKKIAQKYPDVFIRTFAYDSTEALPDNLGESAPNLIFWYCDLYLKSDHLIPIGVGPLNGAQLSPLEKWSKFAKRMEIWDYMLVGERWSSGFPEVAADAISADAKLFRRMGLRRYFCEHYHEQPFWELNQFLYGQLLFDPDRNVDMLIGKYCRLYKKASPKIREVIDFLRKVTAARPVKNANFSNTKILPWRNNKDFGHIRDLLEDAWELEDDVKVRRRIADLLSSVDREMLTFTKQVPKKHAQARADYQRYVDYYLKYSGFTKPIKNMHKKRMERFLKRDAVKFKDLPAELADAKNVISLDYRSLHRFIKSTPDPLSETGRGCCQSMIKPGKFISAGVYDSDTKKMLLSTPSGKNGIFVTPETADGKYHWHRLGTCNIGNAPNLWITPIWVPNWNLAFYRFTPESKDDEGRYNTFEIWVSVRFQGSGFVPGSTQSNAVWVDRVLLRPVVDDANIKDSGNR